MAEPATASLTRLVVGAAEAVRGAQRKLDEQLVYGPAIARSIPRITVDGEFTVRAVGGKTILIFGAKTEEDQSYRVAFTLLLVPDPSPPVEDQALPTAVLYLPPFIESPSAVAKLVFDLCLALEAMDAKLFRDEVEKLRAAAANRDDDPGLVAIRLGGPDNVYLIARIGGRRDGIFLFDRAGTPPVTVVSHWRASGDTLPWGPFHRLFDTLRSWQRGSEAPRKLDGLAPDRIGGLQTKDLLSGLWNGYREVRNLFSSASETPVPSLPAYYDLGKIEAKLSYSVPRSAGAKGAPEPPLIRSEVSVRLQHEKGVAAIELRLRAPEYILVDRQKDAILGLLRENIDADRASLGRDSFYSIVAPGFEAAYSRALRDPARARDALVLLSYVDLPPKNQFLFVWTGVLAPGSEEREFAFRFGLDDDRLVDPEMVMPLEEPSGEPILGLEMRPFAQAEVPYNRDAPALHDFFHAVWIWTIAGKWFPV